MVKVLSISLTLTIVWAKNIVIATGSYPICLLGIEFGDKIMSTITILELDRLPASLTIIGAGYSGCEFASILSTLGSKITLIEAEDHVMPYQIKFRRLEVH